VKGVLFYSCSFFCLGFTILCKVYIIKQRVFFIKIMFPGVCVL